METVFDMTLDEALDSIGTASTSTETSTEHEEE